MHNSLHNEGLPCFAYYIRVVSMYIISVIFGSGYPQYFVFSHLLASINHGFKIVLLNTKYIG
uniref:Uncharacterized protein n=1 Tax=Anguilla anguilla TaxID=7936 RepID=A0A0E9WSH3_ANGAN